MIPLRRSEVYKALGIVGDTIPKTMEGVFKGVHIHARNRWDGEWIGTVVVRQADGSYSKQRIFLLCSCSRLIPFGRIAQHARKRGHSFDCNTYLGVDQ